MSFREGLVDALEMWLETVKRPLEAAQSVRRDHCIESLQDMKALAVANGVQLHSDPSLPPSRPAFSLLVGETRYICIRPDPEPAVEMFSIAHELGHHLLHLGLAEQTPKDTKELEANLFALTLLMTPDPRLNEETLRHNVDGRVAALALTVIPAALLLLLAGAAIVKRFTDGG